MNFKLILYGVIGFLIYDIFLAGKSKTDKYSGTIPIGNTLSYPPYAYTEMVNKLLNAMHGFGTWHEDIYEVFRMIKTNDDAKKLKAEFGLRPYTGALGSFGLLNESVDLSTWLNEELTSSEVSTVRSILKKNNITEHFV